jgi:hypothetical protein
MSSSVEMSTYKDYERVPEAEGGGADEEQQTLLPSPATSGQKETSSSSSIWDCLGNEVGGEKNRKMRNLAALTTAYLAGAISVILLKWLLPDSCAVVSQGPQPEFPFRHPLDPLYRVATPSFPADIGSTVIHEYPPTSPTNAIPAMFPTEVGYAGPTPTGAEPAMVLAASTYPHWDGTAGLIHPDTWGKKGDGEVSELPSWIEDTAPFSKKEKFNIFHNWGNLSPFHSVPRDSFGAKLTSGPGVPAACTLKGAHILHRHGARYPTSWCKPWTVVIVLS